MAAVTRELQAEIGQHDDRQVRLGNTPGDRTIRMTSRPSRTGMSQSMIMISGLTLRMASSAATPSATRRST
jgi:hypothetical protein